MCLLSGLVLKGCLGTLVLRSRFKIPWVRMPMNSKGSMNCLFFVFIACNFKQFHFLLLHGSVCVKRSHTANNGKQRTRLPADLPHIKTKLARVSDTLEACYHNDQAEKCKITNSYKVFSFRACVLAAWCSFFKWCGFNLAVCCEFLWRYSLARPEFIKLSRRRRFHILHIWHTRSPYQSRSLSI